MVPNGLCMLSRELAGAWGKVYLGKGPWTIFKRNEKPLNRPLMPYAYPNSDEALLNLRLFPKLEVNSRFGAQGKLPPSFGNPEDN